MPRNKPADTIGCLASSSKSVWHLLSKPWATALLCHISENNSKLALCPPVTWLFSYCTYSTALRLGFHAIFRVKYEQPCNNFFVHSNLSAGQTKRRLVHQQATHEQCECAVTVYIILRLLEHNIFCTRHLPIHIPSITGGLVF